MNVLEALKNGAGKVATAVGLSEHPNMAKYRQAREFADRLPELVDQQRQVGKELADAEKAFRDGAATWNDLRIEAAISRLRTEHEGVSSKVFYAQKAASEAVGLCPDEKLQRERRDLGDKLRRVTAEASTVEQSEQRLQRELTHMRTTIERMTHELQVDEKRRWERETDLKQRDLTETTERLEALRAELREIGTEKEDLRTRMLSLPL